MSARLHEATEADVKTIWPAARAAHISPTADSFRDWWEREPWRVRVNERGDAVVLVRWRTHLDLLALRALWCPPRRVGDLLQELRGVAAEHELRRLVSPLLAQEAVRPYVRGGMVERERLVALRADPRKVARPDPPRGILLRTATIDECDAIADVESASFDDFWRHGADEIRGDFPTGRLVVACAGQRVVGYTLSGISRGIAALGRLAVDPAVRRRGVGRALVGDIAEQAERQGASAITLCTQHDNTASRALYAACGFRELPGKLVIAVDPEPA